MSEGFDRIRRRGPVNRSDSKAQSMPRTPSTPLDPHGRRALYSANISAPAPWTVTVECSECETTSVVTPRQLVGLAIPSLHLPYLRRDHGSWMRCPECGRRTWVRLHLET